MNTTGGFLLLLLGVIATGCGGRDAHPPTKAATVWSCVIGTQGGFTGGGGGQEIHSDGRVLAWSRITADAETEKSLLGQVEQERLLPLIEALAVEELYLVDLRESGNLTTFLEIRSSKHPTKRWSWPADRMGGRPVKVPTLVRQAYEAASNITREFGERR